MTGADQGALLAATEAQAHQLYFERRDPGAALAPWRLCVGLGAPSLAMQLAVAHCEIEAGIEQDLPAVGVRDPDPPVTARAREYAELILSRAWTLHGEGDARRATKLLRLVAAVDPHLRSVYEQQILAPPAAAAALPEPGDRVASLPFERVLSLTEDAARALIARHGGRRVLLFMPWWRRQDDTSAEGILARQLRVSLEALGIAVTIVESFRLDHPEHLALHERLRGVIAAFQPDVVVCYDMLVSGATSYAPLQDGILAVLQDARRAGAKLVFSYSDSWYDGMADLFAVLAQHTDLFHIPFPGLLRQLPPALAARVFCYPFPVDDPRPEAGRVTVPRPRGAFVGTIGWVNLSRLAWCAEIARAGLPADPALLAECAVSINFVARINGARIATGRAIEAPFVGSVLLEEASDDTAYFLRPYEHYVPFATLPELSSRLRLLLDDDRLRGRIATAGTAWVRRHFAALPFWARLFHQLYEAAPPPPAPPRDIAAVAVRFPHSAQSYFELARRLV